MPHRTECCRRRQSQDVPSDHIAGLARRSDVGSRGTALPRRNASFRMRVVLNRDWPYLKSFWHSIKAHSANRSSTAFRPDHGIYEVRFCAESGHSPARSLCPLSANKRHHGTLASKQSTDVLSIGAPRPRRQFSAHKRLTGIPLPCPASGWERAYAMNLLARTH